MKSKLKPLRWLSLLLAFGLFAAACGDDSDTSSQDDDEPAVTAAESDNESELTTPAAEVADCVVRVGRVVPLTGPLAVVGKMSQWVDDYKLDYINGQGGVTVGDQQCLIESELYDSQSTVAGSAEAATRAILDDGVDVLMAQGTPDTTNAPTEICEREGIPCITSDTPIEAWLFGPDGVPLPHSSTFHFFFGVPDLVTNHLGIINSLPGGFNGQVGYLYPNDADGVAFHSFFDAAFAEQGWVGIDPGRFEQGLPDFSAIVNQFKREDVQVVTGVLAPPDLQNYLQAAAQANFKPLMYIIDKGTGYPDAMNAIGEPGEDILSVNFWSPAFPGTSQYGGWDGQEFVDAYEAANPGQQYGPPGAWEDASFDILFDALERAGSTDGDAIIAALRDTDLLTIVGQVDFNEDNYSVQALGGAQWRFDDDRGQWVKDNVYNAVYPEVAITGDLRLYQAE